MKYIKLIIVTAFLSTMFTGCSYVSDYVEGQITKRASFSVTAQYLPGTDEIKLTWDKTDSSDDFAGIEIYRTTNANDEYASYTLVSNRFIDVSGQLSSGQTGTYTFSANLPVASPLSRPGIYFYRVGIIHWDDPIADRTAANGYVELWNDTSTVPSNLKTNYDNKTDIDAISGYGKVTIP